ncbi:MAG: hypothetical protein CTY34_05300 [Methylobacter sp.]|nr:MAG: hypothetical protein CTY34_05300 [Methylobacter sp.]PPD17588.1 MAG: hypothetical protein CTY24_14620 [Methylobacter sp.]PPD36810.1 MAG: hypothetical protein CTY18_03225 [Methylomonas sp.]
MWKRRTCGQQITTIFDKKSRGGARLKFCTHSNYSAIITNNRKENTMNSISLAEIISQFRAFALENDVELPPSIHADGGNHRFKIAGKLNGYYRLHSNGVPCGFIQNWALHSEPLKWVCGSEFKEYSPEERRQYALEREQAERQRLAQQTVMHQNAANTAAALWAKATPAPPDHPYLQRKQILPHGAKVLNSSLVIPLYDEFLKLASLEFIADDGSKRFLKSGRKSGCFWWIGHQKTDPVMLAEGYATAASLHENTGLQTYIAFDAGNLAKVAQVIRRKRPAVQIVVAGDNDHSGKGQQAANDAAFAVDGLVSLPPELGTDWNDFYCAASNREASNG